jgi:hypothetical protein
LYNEDQLDHGGETVPTLAGYMGTSRFWFESFQNWQSGVPVAGGDGVPGGLPEAARQRPRANRSQRTPIRAEEDLRDAVDPAGKVGSY